MAGIADGDILADVQLEIAAARGQDKGARDGRGPDDLAADETVDMLQHRVAVIAGFGERRVRISAEQNGLGTIYADAAQLA